LTGFSQSDLNVAQKNTTMGQALPLIVGHRGGFDSKLPENSLALFDFTYNNACSKPIGIEFDIRESASGSLFILHDSTVDRTTNGIGKITELKDSYIEALFLRDRNGELTTEKVPTFMEVLKHFQGKKCMLMLDIKGKIYPKVIRMVQEMKMESKCILLTFNQNNTNLVKANTDQIMISALVKNEVDWESLLNLQIPGRQLIAYVNKDAPLELLNEIRQNQVLIMTDFSESIHNNSQPFDPEYYRDYLAKMQLGIIITDYPVNVNRLINKH
jgi:glycerophosphoryl diester phosphodiesterase